MTTKRKTPPEDPVKPIRKLIDKIRKELSCTEAEAYFTLRCSLHPPDVYYDPARTFDEPQQTLEWAIAHTKDILKASDECREDVEKGNHFRLFDAIHVCGEMGFPLPKWATENLERARESYRFHVAKTLDEAFKVKRPRNYPHKKAEEVANLSFNVYWRCKTLHDQGVKFGGRDEDLLERVAEEFKLSRTVVGDYYYLWLGSESRGADPDVPEVIKPLIKPKKKKRPK